MPPLPPALRELLEDPHGKRAEECLLRLILELEHAGVRPKAIARALSRVMISFCMEKGKELGHFGWAYDLFVSIGDVFRVNAAKTRRIWVRKFLARNSQLYVDARFEMLTEHAELNEPIPEPDDLSRLTTHGSA